MKRAAASFKEAMGALASRRGARMAVGLSVWLLATGQGRAQLGLANEILDTSTGTRLEMRSVFDPMPSTGCAPVRVVITSGAARDSTWTFDFESRTQMYRAENSHRSHFSVGVPARSTQSALFLVPMAVEYGNTHSGYYGNTSLRINVEAGGVASKNYSSFKQRTRGMPAIAISPALADASMTKLKKEITTRASSSSTYMGPNAEFGSQFKLDDLPEDWLGYGGFDVLMFSHADWGRLRPGVRRAIDQWVRLGGRLHVYAPAAVTDDALGLDGGAEMLKKPVGLGRIARFNWDGKELNASEIVGRYWAMERRESDLLEGRAGLTKGASYWPLLEVIGERGFASWQVVLFLVLFGVLVGPVNLFVLAPSGRRHRLFVTTPVISIGASVLMIAVILFQDGTGGTGARFVAVNLQPAEASACVTQEQVSRTGVLLSGAFDMKQPAQVEPVVMPARPWVKLHSGANPQTTALVQDGALRSGNFFQSRAEQGQLLRAGLPTRARVERKTASAPGAPPVLVSALGFSVATLYYVDAQGEAWKTTAPLASGSEATLVKGDLNELRTAWSAAIAPASHHLRQQLEDQTAGVPRGQFFATASATPGFVLDTLPSVRWSGDQAVLWGTVP